MQKEKKKKTTELKTCVELVIQHCLLLCICSLDGKFCRSCWNDIVLTLRFSRWHLFQTPEARDLCVHWLWRGQWWLPQCCFMTPTPWISHTSLCSICHSNADNISIPQSLTVLIVTSWDHDGVLCKGVSARLNVQTTEYNQHRRTIHLCEEHPTTETNRHRHMREKWPWDDIKTSPSSGVAVKFFWVNLYMQI